MLNTLRITLLSLLMVTNIILCFTNINLNDNIINLRNKVERTTSEYNESIKFKNRQDSLKYCLTNNLVRVSWYMGYTAHQEKILSINTIPFELRFKEDSIKLSSTVKLYAR